jgi:hypothetical protein
VSNTTVVTNNTVESFIGNAQVTARGKQASVPVAAAEKDVNGKRITENLTGVAVTATSYEDIQSFAVAGNRPHIVVPKMASVDAGIWRCLARINRGQLDAWDLG